MWFITSNFSLYCSTMKCPHFLVISLFRHELSRLVRREGNINGFNQASSEAAFQRKWFFLTECTASNAPKCPKLALFFNVSRGAECRIRSIHINSTNYPYDCCSSWALYISGDTFSIFMLCAQSVKFNKINQSSITDIMGFFTASYRVH